MHSTTFDTCAANTTLEADVDVDGMFNISTSTGGATIGGGAKVLGRINAGLPSVVVQRFWEG